MQSRDRITYDDLEKVIHLYSEGKSEVADQYVREALEEFEERSRYLVEKLNELSDYFCNRDNNKAVEYLNKIHEIQPDNIDCISKAIELLRLEKRSNDVSIKVKEIAASVKKPKILEVIKSVGTHYLDVKEYDNAFECFYTIILKVAPDASYEGVGSRFLQGNEYEKAFKCYNEILQIAPDNDSVIGNTIESLRYARSFNDTSKKIEEISKWPFISIRTKIILKKQCGWLYFERKQYKEAFKTFNDSIFDLLPKDAPDYINAAEGKIASLRSQRLLKDAEELLDKLDPNTFKDEAIQNHRCWLYFDHKSYDKAIKEFDQNLKSLEKKLLEKPDDDRLRWHKGVAYEGLIASYRLKKDFQEAKRIVGEALEQNLGKNKPAIINAEGLIFFDEWVSSQDQSTSYQLLEKAEESFNEAFESAKHYWPQPRFNQIYVLRIIKALKRSDPENKKADNEINKNKKETNDKIDEIIKKLENKFPTDSEIIEQIGWVHLLDNKIQKAEIKFQQILKNDKENIWGINGLGAVYFAQGEYKKAEESFKKILVYEPKNPIFLSNLALTLLNQGESPSDAQNYCDEALKQCDEALKQDSNYAPALLCKAIIAFRRGRYHELEDYLEKSEAEKKLKKALCVSPNNIQAYLALGNLHFQKANLYDDKKKAEIQNAIERFEEAQKIEETQKKSNEIDKNDKNNRALSGAYLLALMQSEKSLKELRKQANDLRQILHHQDNSTRWLSHLALSCFSLYYGDKIRGSKLRQWFHFLASKLSKQIKTSSYYYEEALQEANHAKHLKPTNPQAYFYSGIIHYRLKSYEDTLEDFETYLKNTSEESEHYFEIKQYINHVKLLITQSQQNVGWSIKTSFIIAMVILIIEIVIFVLLGIDRKELMSLISTLAIFFVVVSFLPSLKHFKLPNGLEAEIMPLKKEVKPPTIPIISVPNDEVGFCSLSPTITSSWWLGSKSDRLE
ncbi:MAG: tetratricopeptide repeat protein [Candidatus Competibacteraceae bacterium]